MSLSTLEARQRRHRRIRGKIAGTAERPRLAVARSNRRIYAQLIDDERGHTLVAAGSHEAALRDMPKGPAAAEVGKLPAPRVREAGVEAVVFARGGYRYQGRVRALADGAREGGLHF